MGVVFEMAALKVLSSAAVLLFGTVLLMATARRISTCAYLFAFQSLVLVGEVASVAYIQHSREAWFVAGMVFAVKVIAIPYALLWLMRRLHTPHDVGASISPGHSVFVMAGVIFVSFWAVRLSRYAHGSLIQTVRRIPQDVADSGCQTSFDARNA